MNLQNIFLASGLLICLFASLISFGILVRRANSQIHPALIITGLAFAGAAVCICFACDYQDFISPVSEISFLAPLLASVPVAFMMHGTFRLPLRALVMFVCATAVLMGFNFEFPFSESLPAPAWQLLMALLWTFFALSLRLMNGLPALAASQVSSAGFGLLLLYFLGATPFAVGFTGGCLAAAAAGFLLYNWYPSTIELPDNDADLLGFFLGGLLIWCCAEGAAAPAVIFILLTLCEAVFALIQKLTFLPRYAETKENTAYAKAAALRLSPAAIASFVLKINVLLILFGCFAIYAPNQTSLLLICTVITMWQLYRLMNWNTLSAGFRDTNQNVIKELKKNFSAFKKNADSNRTDDAD